MVFVCVAFIFAWRSFLHRRCCHFLTKRAHHPPNPLPRRNTCCARRRPRAPRPTRSATAATARSRAASPPSRARTRADDDDVPTHTRPGHTRRDETTPTVTSAAAHASARRAVPSPFFNFRAMFPDRALQVGGASLFLFRRERGAHICADPLSSFRRRGRGCADGGGGGRVGRRSSAQIAGHV